jgi:hypothetical protein
MEDMNEPKSLIADEPPLLARLLVEVPAMSGWANVATDPDDSDIDGALIEGTLIDGVVMAPIDRLSEEMERVDDGTIIATDELEVVNFGNGCGDNVDSAAVQLVKEPKSRIDEV